MAVKERQCFARFVNFKGFNWNSAKTEKLFNKSYTGYLYLNTVYVVVEIMNII